MAIDINREVVIRINLLNGATTKKELDEINKEVDEFTRKTNLSTKAQDELGKAQAKATREFANGTRQLRAAKQGYQDETRAKRESARAAQELAKAQSNLYARSASQMSREGSRQAIFANINQTLYGNADATSKASQAQVGMAASLPRLRYALYDVSTTATVAGAAMLALATATAGTAIKMDREFADVVRTTGTYLDQTGQQTAALRDEFNDLFSSLPASWTDLTNIGTLAGQLGVASENVAEFTSLVTKFSTVTGVTVEASATAFGRLSELLNVSASEYENLGSAILATGVSSVATENDIISISSQIASMGDYAGFSADEVVGLSSALASLGVRPELARGTVTRLFTKISTAIADGGEKLEAFGSVAGVTGQQFATAWGEDASGALQKFLQGLGKIDETGGSSIGTLKELGITSTRDVPTLLKLAQNTELVAEQFEIAKNGFEDGTAIQDQYGVVAETVAEKLNVLKNNVSLLTANLGSSTGPLSTMISGITTLLQGLNKLSGNKAVQTISLIVLGLTALAGAMALSIGVAARGAGSYAAVRTALIELAGAAYTAKTGLDSASASMWGLVTASNGVKKALISTGVGAVLVALGTAVAYFVGKADEASRANDELVSSLKSAVQADTRTYEETGEKLGSVVRQFEDVAGAVKDTEPTYSDFVQANIAVQDASDDTSDSLGDQKGEVTELIVAYGELTDAALRASLANSDAGKELFNLSQQGLLPEGFSTDELLSLIIKDPDNSQAVIADYLNTVFSEARQKVLQTADISTGTEVQENLNALTSAQDEVSAASDSWAQSLVKVADEMARNAFFGVENANATDAQGDAASVASAEYDAMVDSIKEAISAQTEMLDLSLSTESALASLGSGLSQGGLDWSQYTEAGRENLGNLLAAMDAIAAETPGNASAIASNFQAMYDTLINGGYATTAQLAILRESIQNLVSQEGAQITNTGRDFTSFFNGWAGGADKARKSTASARKEVRTLLDYASDLAKVWDRAFDIRFNSQATLDKITTTFLDLKEAADESAKAIADLNREINGLQTDLATQEYFLSVALDYGDTLRAAEIQQEIADIQAEMAGKQADLTKEQAKNSKVLTGNSRAAIDNREEITGLVKQYEDHIKALAESGLSSQELATRTQQLKQQFLAQTSALGYARPEMERYASAFDDVATAISKVPRNITVTANADPALQALNELQSRLDSVRASAGQPINLGAISNNTNAKELRRAALEGYIGALNQQLRVADPYGARVIGNVLYDIQRKLYTGNYYDGGFTGKGGKYQYAGAVHKGEYVIPQEGVDQRTGLPKPDYVGNLSRSASNAPSFARGGYAGSMMGYNGPVTLSAASIQQLAQVLPTKVMIDRKVLAQIINEEFAMSTSRGSN